MALPKLIPTKLPTKLIPIIGAAVVALAIGGGAGWYVGSGAAAPKSEAAHEAQHEAPKEKETPHEAPKGAKSGPEPMPYSYAIKDRVVNLADPGARRYLKVSLSLDVLEHSAEAAKRKAPPSAEEQKKFQEEFKGLFDAKVNDVLTTVLSAKRVDEVTSNDGRERVREELKEKINALMPKDEQVSRVYLTDFIVQ
jgi:flagellar FliL protein